MMGKHEISVGNPELNWDDEKMLLYLVRDGCEIAFVLVIG